MDKNGYPAQFGLDFSRFCFFERKKSHHRTMPPKESPVWQYLNKEVQGLKGNQKASCKGCAKSFTMAPAQWWLHLHVCDGAEDPEAADIARTAADKVLREAAEAKARANASASFRRTQATLPQLNKQQLNDAADEAIATWSLARRIVTDGSTLTATTMLLASR